MFFFVIFAFLLSFPIFLLLLLLFIFNFIALENKRYFRLLIKYKHLTKVTLHAETKD